MDDIHVAERLVRIETKQDIINEKLDQHLERHYSLGVKTFLAVLGAACSLVIALIK